MSFFNKLFSSPRSSNVNQVDVSKSSVRVLIYRECERRGRKLLFDSNAVEKLALPCQQLHCRAAKFVQLTSSYGYRYKKPNSDVGTFVEMVFGSVALSFKETLSYKIHYLGNPDRIMFSVIVPNTRCKRERRDSPSSKNGESSDSNFFSKCSLDSDSCIQRKSSLSSSENSSFRQSQRCCSNLSSLGEFSLCCEDIVLSPLKVLNDESELIINGRQRSISTSESSSSLSLFGSFYSTSDGSVSSCSSKQFLPKSYSSNWEPDDDGHVKKSATRIGLVVVIDISTDDNLEPLLLYHNRHVEAILGRLINEVEVAYSRSNEFVSRMMAASDSFRSQLESLVSTLAQPFGPFSQLKAKTETNSMFEQIRSSLGVAMIKEPFSSRDDLFVRSFYELLTSYDKKETNFFITTLITAVLTHNTDWVSSLDKKYLPKSPILNYTVKTIITSVDRLKNFSPQLLTALSYFLRPNNYFENVYDIDIETVANNSSLHKDVHSYFEIGCDLMENTAIGESIVDVSCDQPDYAGQPKLSYMTLLKSSRSAHTNLNKLKDVTAANQSEVVGKFVSRLYAEECSRDCCNSLLDQCSGKSRSLYPNLKEMAELENIKYQDLTDSGDKEDRTLFVNDLLSSEVDEGYQTISSSASVKFVLGFDDPPPKVVTTKSCKIDLEPVVAGEEYPRLSRSQSLNVPLSIGASILRKKNKTLDNSFQQCIKQDSDQDASSNVDSIIKEIPVFLYQEPSSTKKMPSTFLFGGVHSSFQPQFDVQCVSQSVSTLESVLFNNLASQSAYIVGDTEEWSVLLVKNQPGSFGKSKNVRVASSKLIADMLESFAQLYSFGLSSEKCILHLERRLHEIYSRSIALAEFLLSKDFCNIEDVTSMLNVAVNDVPLLMAVAYTHSPSLLDKYGISFS